MGKLERILFVILVLVGSVFLFFLSHMLVKLWLS